MGTFGVSVGQTLASISVSSGPVQIRTFSFTKKKHFLIFFTRGQARRERVHAQAFIQLLLVIAMLKSTSSVVGSSDFLREARNPDL